MQLQQLCDCSHSRELVDLCCCNLTHPTPPSSIMTARQAGWHTDRAALPFWMRSILPFQLLPPTQAVVQRVPPTAQPACRTARLSDCVKQQHSESSCTCKVVSWQAPRNPG